MTQRPLSLQTVSSHTLSMDSTFQGKTRAVHARESAPRNLATLMQVSRSVLKGEACLNMGIQGWRLQANGREDHLINALLR